MTAPSTPSEYHMTRTSPAKVAVAEAVRSSAAVVVLSMVSSPFGPGRACGFWRARAVRIDSTIP